MIKPLVVYTAHTFDNRIELVVRYQTIFDARKGTSGAIKHFNAHGLRCRVNYHYVEPASGGYEVGLCFAHGVDEESVHYAMFNKPPYSNRGVTK